VFELVVPVSSGIWEYHASQSGVVLQFLNSVCVGVEFSCLRPDIGAPCAGSRISDSQDSQDKVLLPPDLVADGDGIQFSSYSEDLLHISWRSTNRHRELHLFPSNADFSACFGLGLSGQGRLWARPVDVSGQGADLAH